MVMKLPKLVGIWCCLLVLVIPGQLWAAGDVFEIIADADSAFFQGDLDTALTRYQKALSSDKENIYALNKIALIHIKQGHVSKARQTYAQLVAIEPDDTFSRYWLGILQLKEKNIDKAFDEFSTIINLDPNDSNAVYAHMFLGAIYTYRHQPYQAILELKKARLKADKPDVHYKLARAYHDAGMFANATLEYIRTLEMAPRNFHAIDGLGWILYNQGKTDQAIAACNRD